MEKETELIDQGVLKYDQEVTLSEGVFAQEECNLALHIGPCKTFTYKVKRNVQAGLHW
jgi:hypothetical protein